MAKYSADEQVLMALYAEWLSDEPDFRRVNAINLQMDPDKYLWALMKLKKSGYIEGIDWKPEYATVPEQVAVLDTAYMSISAKGVERAAEIVGAGKKRAYEVLSVIGGIFRDLGIAAFSGMITLG